MARRYRRWFSFLSVSLIVRGTFAAVVGAGAFVASSDVVNRTPESVPRSLPPIDRATDNSPAPRKVAELSKLTSFSEHKLQINDGEQGVQFGFSVAVSGNTAVVGAPGDNDNKGAAYVYALAGGEWIFQQKLLSADGTSDDHFGWDVAVSADTVIVGAYDLNEVDQGAAYVFKGNNGVWTQQQKLTPASGSATDQFGSSVAISGDTALVGAFGSNGFRGAAYVFTRNGEIWTEQGKLLGSDSAANDELGWSVALSGDIAIVGAPRNQAAKGAAYVFTRTGSVWSEQEKITGSDGSDFAQFGYSVAIDGETAIIGAVLDGGEASNGSAYVFERTGTSWPQMQKLTANEGGKNDKFGGSVSINGDVAVIGANGRDVDGVADHGSSFVFTRAGSVWSLQQELFPSDAAVGDNFGGSVAIGSGVVIAGSYLKNHVNSTGVPVLDHGAAYLFTLPAQTVEVSGRVISEYGNAVRGAKVILTDTASGTASTSITAQLGFFTFQNVTVGRNYRITVTSKRYRYNQQTFDLTGARSDLEFIGIE